MKRKIIVVSILIMCLLCACDAQKEYTGEMDVTNSNFSLTNEGYIENITVVVDKEEIIDYEACAWEIIDHCISNDFRSVKFSYDIKGYPNGLIATVYVKGSDEPILKMDYVTDSYKYNIKDNPDMYTLVIENFD